MKVCFDSKAFYALVNLGFTPGSFDISLAAYLLNPGRISGLDDVLLQVLDVYQPSEN